MTFKVPSHYLHFKKNVSVLDFMLLCNTATFPARFLISFRDQVNFLYLSIWLDF